MKIKSIVLIVPVLTLQSCANPSGRFNSPPRPDSTPTATRAGGGGHAAPLTVPKPSQPFRYDPETDVLVKR